MKKFYLLALSSLFIGCYSNRFLTHDIVSITKQHEHVAVLPVHVVITGNLPKNVTNEQLVELYKIESRLFQDALLTGILNETRNGKTPYWVKFLSNDETHSILAKKGLALKDISDQSPTDLAEMLNVDAVVKARVVKERFMSETLSAVIGVSETIIETVSNLPIYVPKRMKRTYNVNMNVELVNATTGSNLYHRSLGYNIDYRNSVTDVVYLISDRVGKYFPYKEHKLKKQKKYRNK